jgi:hypothetical protein
MKDYVVPIAVQSELHKRADALIKKEFPMARYRYCPDARGKFIYLCRLMPNGTFQRLGRLTYTGDLENMEFAIFKFSSGKYDPKERWFPGAQYLDGTIEGALKALTEAYP